MVLPVSTSDSRPNPRGLTLAAVEAALSASLPELRARGLGERIYAGLFRERAPDLASIADIGARKRVRLAEVFDDRGITLVERRVAPDRSARHVFRLDDGALIESVLLWHHDLWTVCVSSQAGCALACDFCATGRLGWKRDLAAWEIVDQVIQVGRVAGVRVSDVVFMGMGEPLLNEAAVYQAARVLNETKGLQIGRRRVTISTAGIVPAIHRFIDAGHPWRLVFSLGAASPAKRAALMPVQQRHSFAEFLDAVRRYERHRRGKHVTLEYVAIPGLTMGDDDVDAIAEHLRDLRFILNVIPNNDVGNGYAAPTMTEVRAFTAKLRPLGIPVKIRYSGGQDESAGCGQLGAALLAEGRLEPRAPRTRAPRAG